MSTVEAGGGSPFAISPNVAPKLNLPAFDVVAGFASSLGFAFSTGEAKGGETLSPNLKGLGATGALGGRMGFIDGGGKVNKDFSAYGSGGPVAIVGTNPPLVEEEGDEEGTDSAEGFMTEPPKENAFGGAGKAKDGTGGGDFGFVGAGGAGAGVTEIVGGVVVMVGTEDAATEVEEDILTSSEPVLPVPLLVLAPFFPPLCSNSSSIFFLSCSYLFFNRLLMLKLTKGSLSI